MPARLVGIDIRPWAGQLEAWGHGPDGWWALVTWAEQVQAFGESHRALQCAAWVHASHIRPGEHARPDEYVDRAAAPHCRRPTDVATAGYTTWLARPDRGYLGVLDGGELPVPLSRRPMSSLCKRCRR
jgi:hypothetical protein